MNPGNPETFTGHRQHDDNMAGVGDPSAHPGTATEAQADLVPASGVDRQWGLTDCYNNTLKPASHLYTFRMLSVIAYVT